MMTIPTMSHTIVLILSKMIFQSFIFDQANQIPASLNHVYFFRIV